MATATQNGRIEQPLVSAISDGRREYRCECTHPFSVVGGGRHRVYFEPTDTRLDHPVMDRVCPECGRGLPGRNGP